MSNKGGTAAKGKSEKKKENILDLSKWLDSPVAVKFGGGREVFGILKGFDALLNLVLDDCEEYLRDPEDVTRLLDTTRKLGRVVCRGTAVVTINPPGEEISNPYEAEAMEQQI